MASLRAAVSRTHSTCLLLVTSFAMVAWIVLPH